MTVQDDVRRLSQMDSIYLGFNVQGLTLVTSWHKGRLQQANDGNWTFRSSGQDGGVVGFQLGPINADWTSNEFPSQGISVMYPVYNNYPYPTQPPTNLQIVFATVFLQQQLPLELTN